MSTLPTLDNNGKTRLKHNKRQIFKYLHIRGESRKESLFQKLGKFFGKQCTSLYLFNVEVNCILVQININCQSFENVGIVPINILFNFFKTILFRNQVDHFFSNLQMTFNSIIITIYFFSEMLHGKRNVSRQNNTSYS